MEEDSRLCSCNCHYRKVQHRRSVYGTSHLPLMLADRVQQPPHRHKRSDSGLTFALQALLDRHEAYVKESQAEQARLSGYVHRLEDEKANLQDVNHRMVVENRELLQKLEKLNTDFGQSGTRVNELEDLLQQCEQEVRRLNGLTRKTQELELRVMDMEREHAELAKDLEDGQNETRGTIARWKESERKVRQLEQEVQKIEWDARLDRERHEEIVARMERDRTLEREMGLSEGRLKATAAVQTMQHSGTQKQVVSNFVRDILQDNANLQSGIAELRELLQSSNDEVQNLRDQVMLHQPVQEDEPPIPQRTLSLGDELSLSQSAPKKQVQQEVHVHHHYHTKLGGKKDKTPVRTSVRKTPRRRALMSSGTLSSSPSSSGASTPIMRPQRHASSPAIPLSIGPNTNRWSVQSTATTSTYMSSMASSPQSHYDRKGSIFDRLERDEESSRPTSPESFSIISPMPFKRRDRAGDQALSIFEEEGSILEEDVPPLEPNVCQEAPILDNSRDTADPENHNQGEEDKPPDMDLTPKPSMSLKRRSRSDSLPAQTSEPELPEPLLPPDPSFGEATSKATESEHPLEPSQEPQVDATDFEADLDTVPANDFAAMMTANERPKRLHQRSSSHESLFSLSGMDIHLAQQSSRSTLALLGGRGHGLNKHHFTPLPNTLRQAPTSITQPSATVTEYTATSRLGLDTTSASMQALSGIRRQGQTQTSGKGLIGSVGGWMSSKWGKAPTNTKSIADLRAAVATPSISARPRVTPNHFATSPALTVVKPSNASVAPSMTTTSSGKRSVSSNVLSFPSPSATQSTTDAMTGSLSASAFFGRQPGINQSGPIPGFAAAVAAKRTPTTLNPSKVDISTLRESLAGQ